MSFQFYDDLEKFEQLENLRTSTVNDPQYQQWVKELNISQSYVEPDGYIRAKELNSQYDYSRTRPASSILNFLKVKGIW